MRPADPNAHPPEPSRGTLLDEERGFLRSSPRHTLWPEGSLRDTRALPQVLAAGPDLIALARALRRRWGLAVALGILLAGAAVVVAWKVPPKPKATAYALVQVTSRAPQVAFTTIDITAETLTPPGVLRNTQLVLIKSRGVLEAALKMPEVARLPIVQALADPVEWLEQDLLVEYVENSEILRVSLSGPRPDELKVVVDAVAKAYLNEIVNVDAHRRKERFGTLKTVYDKYQDSLQRKRKALRKLAETIGSDDKQTLAVRQRFAIEHLAQTEAELLKLKSELRRNRVELAAEQTKLEHAQRAMALSNAAIEEALSQDPLVRSFAVRVEQARSKLEALGSHVSRVAKAGTTDAYFQRYRVEFQSARDTYTTVREQRRPIVAERLRNRLQNEMSGRISQLQERVRTAEQLDRVLSAEVARLNESASSFGRDSMDLEMIKDEIAQSEEAARKVGSEMEALSVELEAPPRIRLVQPASVSRPNDRKKRLMMTSMAGISSFTLVLLGVSFWECQARRVGDPQEVNGLGLRIVGALPALPPRGRRGRRRLDAGKEQEDLSVLLESIDTTRTLLLHSPRSGPARVVLITSALEGEGKTALASHLAASLARASRRTLLVDGNLRDPMLHKLFDVPPAQGWCELLKSGAAAEAMPRPTPLEGLWIVPAGHCDQAAFHALAGAKTAEVIDGWRQHFDAVVIDSAPVLPIVDTLLIAPHVDAVLLAVRKGVSRLPKVFDAKERLAGVNARLIGAVVFGAKAERSKVKSRIALGDDSWSWESSLESTNGQETARTR
jgi:succinoglycan biosynthesis transport protein ExoP